MALPKTRREKLQEAARQVRRRAILERWFEPKMRRALKKMAKEAAKGYTEGGIDQAMMEIDEQRKEIETLLNSFYERAIGQTSAGVKSWLPMIEKKDFFGAIERLIGFFRGTALTNSISIAETSKEDVRRIMEPLVANFETEGTIAKAIEDSLKAKSRSRAQLIARTESGIATSTTQYEIVQEVETLPMLKEWVTTFRNSRDSHKDIDGTKLNKDEYFSVRRKKGGVDRMLHPHARGASAESICNCMCVLVWVPAFDIPEFDEEAAYAED
jgi:hypothetical protein